MREIKFRAWDVKGLGFVAGFNMVNYHSYFNKGLSPSIYRYSTEWEDGDYILEQFTGLHDTNGVEIYEGDIVVFNNECTSTKKEYWYPVFHLYYEATQLVYKRVGGGKAGDSIFFNLKHYSGKFEVIGNIHENPELLEGLT